MAVSESPIVGVSPYNFLDPSKASFRVVVLLPGQHHNAVRCELRVVSMVDSPSYEVVSYLWGPATRGLTVILEGVPMVVTDNLYSALTHIRYPDKERIIWVDALSINQSDVQEKTQQVRMMGTIYEGSQQCLVWVGEVPDDDDEIPSYTLQDAQAALNMISLLAASDTEQTLPSCLNTRDGRKGAVRAIRGMMLFGNKWWQRIWTVQEAVLPKKKTIVWRTLSISWDTCVEAAWGLMYPSEHQRRIIVLLSPELYSFSINEFITPFLSLHLTQEEALRRPLLTAHRWRYRIATDPRDKVYGLMGLFMPTQLPSIDCDYSLPTATVFTRFTLDLLHSEGTLSPLIGLRGEPHATPGLPTWALDLVRPTDLINEGCPFWEHDDRYKHFKADNHLNLEFDTTHNDSVLSLKGFQVDVICLVDDGIAADEKALLPNEDFIHVTKRRQTILEEVFKDSPGQLVAEKPWQTVFCRTMLGDVITEQERVKRRATAEDEDSFLRFLDDGKWNDVVESLRSMVMNQSFFVTEKGHMGIGPPGIRKGDAVWVLGGGRVPFVLRPTKSASAQTGGNGLFSLVGDAFVYGIMDGELLTNGKMELQNVYLC
ncbi:heterokaryon incompatibility protein-domain-containing protein [Paramyrothecium foliicola]|nr:heterokaryon incompatibility protein-domain-containing protein [Paramyrothecium foliicola]